VSRAFLIDLYDTLVRSDWGRWRADLSAGAGISLETLDRAFHDTRAARNTGEYRDLHDSTRAIVLAAGLPDDPEIVRWWVAMDEKFMEDGVELYEDSLPTVRALRERGDSAVLVSNCGHDTRLLVDRLGLEDEFDHLILSFELGYRKPDAAIYEAAMLAVEARPDQSLFVDDQVDYCDGARALAIGTRLIIRRDTNPSEGIAPFTNGHPVITDLASILERQSAVSPAGTAVERPESAAHRLDR
jgi:HAD superfamily hydrolase (TIGR01509 family)